jgi:hypothetical protein
VYNRKEWKKLLGTARNCRILHITMEWNVRDTVYVSPVVQPIAFMPRYPEFTGNNR